MSLATAKGLLEDEFVWNSKLGSISFNTETIESLRALAFNRVVVSLAGVLFPLSPGVVSHADEATLRVGREISVNQMLARECRSNMVDKTNSKRHILESILYHSRP